MAEDSGMGLQPGPGSGGLIEAFRNLGKFASQAAVGVSELTQATIGATSSMDAAAKSAENATGKMNSLADAATKAKSALGTSSFDAAGNPIGGDGSVSVLHGGAPAGGTGTPIKIPGMMTQGEILAMIEQYRLKNPGASWESITAAIMGGIGRP